MAENIMEASKRYDFAVIGSGFGGSITAMGLKQMGYSVCIIEKGIHPRFAIGESSTPIADMILRDIADNYKLPFLKQISRYGEWQKFFPEVRCGLKRGFSYYHHQKGKWFESDSDHKHELLVAASLDDYNSDTNWLRIDVDQFLLKKAKKIGVDVFENSEIVQLDRIEEQKEWAVRRESGNNTIQFSAKWIIDATGSGHFSKKFFNTTNEVSTFKTNSEAIYTHFRGVPTWLDYLNEQKISVSDYPYSPDDSALHHIIDEGWIWMLRFNDGLLSCGVVMDKHSKSNSEHRGDHQDLWNDILIQYPSIHEILKNSAHANSPGRFIYSDRLQRKLSQTFGEGWIALNHTAGFVDPMHSTGIAFTLSGIERLLDLFRDRSGGTIGQNELKKIQDKTFKELEFIDLLVSSTYRSRWNPELFTAAVMLYFVASVQYEQARLQGNMPEMFLAAHNSDLRQLVLRFHDDILALDQNKNVEKAKELVKEITKSIEPFNTVGLMDDAKKNMYRHTAVVL
jgi:FADH2 O2-dependent halogenase